MPSKSLRQELLDSVMDKYDHFEPNPVENPVTSQSPITKRSPKTQMTKKSSLKPTYINPVLDTTEAYVPLEPPKSSENSKLVLGSQPLQLDDTIPTYGRTGKKAYKEVQYDQDYQPPEFKDPGFKHRHVKFHDTMDKAEIPNERPHVVQQPRRSQKLKNHAKTKWKPTKTAQAKAIPLSKSNKDKKLRAYHARLDILNGIFQPTDDIYGWQVEHFDKHLVKKEDDKINIFFKVIWFGGDKQWVHMDDLRLHDPLQLVKYVITNKLLSKPGWEWTKHYVESN